MSAPRVISRLASRAALARRSPLAATASRRVAIASTSTLPATAFTSMSVRNGSTLPPRSTSFTKPTEEHLKDLKAILSTPTSLLSTLDGSATPDDLASYNDDWMNKYHGKSPIVVKPRTTEEVSKVMKYCYEKGLAVVPQGGNTGLVGGSNPVHDEIILNISNLNKIRSFDEVSGVLVADGGVILEAADHALAEKGFIFPLDLGAKGSCHIGGNVATNAGGLRLLRYGSLHGSVLGLEVVLPDGTIWDGLSKLRKDNTGFDLKQLFIGSEGTIGIITGISIHCPRRPAAMNVAVFSLDSYEAVQKVFAEAKGHLGEILSAFEFFDKQSYALVKKHQEENGGERKVFDQEGDFYCLIETGGSNAEHDEAKLTGLLEHLLGTEMVLDGVLAQDSTQFQSLWSLRELVPESAGKAGSVYKYDVSVPVGKMYGLVEKMRAKLREGGVLEGDGNPEGPIRAVAGYGHMGDGNLHINIVANKYSDEVEKIIEPYVYEIVAENDGSISAEHGLGVMKAPYIGYSKNDVSIEMMRKIKTLFDPKGLLNPYKYII
ncbi:D-lactate dehydrogenase [Kwoniella heveanensis CBS 569]|uniref:D-lactate dehydrogenase n=1 Tax=Kwoniella heveanensis BCC8398 TaxID=1296120 RepID=A0A1B9GQU5_9TREE|nr:D-lactate dehydrogenase [Kwoniella heveanensis BCC8398]OCF40177.1 D-lactate dehydrogenase [Kwoniella heveanensis CBS 569]